jgi:hypothetical protein
MNWFKRWRRSRSEAEVESTSPSMTQPAVTTPVASPTTSHRSRRPATMGRTAAEQAYLAQAAMRAKSE